MNDAKENSPETWVAMETGHEYAPTLLAERDAALRDLAAEREKVERLTAALRVYGRHLGYSLERSKCEAYEGLPCDCGLSAALGEQP